MTQKIMENVLLLFLLMVAVSDGLQSTISRTTSTQQRQRIRRQPLRLMPIEDLTTSSPFSSTVPADYVPPDVGIEIYAGTIIAVLPFIWASIKFGNRISIQQNCLVCKGCMT